MEGKKVKSKSLKLKIITVIILMMATILGVTNAYATTIGYKNLFFAINNKFKPVDVTAYGKDEILSNKDITISYQSVKIADDLSIQVNKLIVEENEAVLQITVEYTSDSPRVKAKNCLVYDETTEVMSTLVGNEELKATEGKFTQDIKLIGIKENTSKLRLVVQDERSVSIASFKIDLNNKQIDIISEDGSENESSKLEKIPETELKEVLSEYAKIHMYEDLDAMSIFHTPREYKNEQMVIIALNRILGNENKNSASKDVVHKAIKEFTGKEIKNYLSLSNLVATYDNKEYSFTCQGYRGREALVLSIEDISYNNGVYNVKFIYCYPTEEDYTNNNIENIEEFVGEIDLRINSEYDYFKYRIDNLSTFVSYRIYDESENVYANIIQSNNIFVNNAVNNFVTNNVTINNTTENTNTIETELMWKEIWVPGIKTIIPENWNIEVLDDCYSGQEDEDTISATITGEIDGDKVLLDIFMPKFVYDCNSTDEFCRKVAREYGVKYWDAGYVDENGNMNWGTFGFEVVPQGYQTSCYCHFENLSDPGEGIGYVIINNIESPNMSYRTFEVLDTIFTNITLTSF